MINAVAKNSQSVSEAIPLAKTLADAYKWRVESYVEQLDLSPSEAVGRASENNEIWAGRCLRSNPESVSFYDLAALAKIDPDKCEKRWGEIKEAARADLSSGHRAAKVHESVMSGAAWPRASYLALREELVTSWHAQGGMELSLVDMLAQAWTAQMYWFERLTLYSTLETDNSVMKADGRWKAPRVGDKEAIDQAAQMVDRFSRIFMRTLRGLRDLRRHASTVVVQNAGSVSVVEKQVNLNG